MFQFITALSVVLLVLIDQLIKLAVLKYLEPVGSIPVLNKVLQLTYVENTGAAFGAFSKYTVLLSVFTAIVLAGLIVYLLAKKIKFGMMYLSLIFIISGGFGNLIDRVFRGYVIDYIDPLFVKFAVFNFADILVTVGAAMLIIYMLYDMIRDTKKQKKQSVPKNE